MLKLLNISNFAVIDHLELDFYTGLNLLTGETGSGKSIIVDALGLLLGGRSSTVQIRTGQRLAVVEGVFEVPEEGEQHVRKILAESGIEKERGEEVIIRREINANGKGRIFINDQVLTAATLRMLQPFLVEIHGQGEQRSLFSAQSQLELLDSFAGCVPLRQEVAEAYARWRSTLKDLEFLESELAERERAGELLQYQLAEIKGVAPRRGEDEDLLTEKRLLTHAERILQLSMGAYTELYESDVSVLSRLSSIRRQLEELNEIDARLAPLLQTLMTVMMSLTDMADELRGYGEAVEFSPTRLAQIEDRLAELERLKRKYNSDLESILKVGDELSERLSMLSDLADRERLQRELFARAEADYIAAAGRLTSRRGEAAPALAERVMADLRHVALEQARFIVSIETAQPGLSGARDESSDQMGALDKAYYSPTGADRVEFLLSANPGESPRPLSRVASGGELSRLMLTLRIIGRGGEGSAHSSETLVFDEIDVGIGGAVAEAVGRRLKALAATRQVLCVTHQPQIARFADHHYRVDKSVEGGRTMTTVKELSQEERITELARMIGGAEEAASTREAARWLLQNAGLSSSWRPARPKRSQKISNS